MFLGAHALETQLHALAFSPRLLQQREVLVQALLHRLALSQREVVGGYHLVPLLGGDDAILEQLHGALVLGRRHVELRLGARQLGSGLFNGGFLLPQFSLHALVFELRGALGFDELALRGVQDGLGAFDIALGQGLRQFVLNLGAGQLALHRLQSSLPLRNFQLVEFRVDAGQQVALLDRLPRLDRHAQQTPRHFRTHRNQGALHTRVVGRHVAQRVQPPLHAEIAADHQPQHQQRRENAPTHAVPAERRQRRRPASARRGSVQGSVIVSHVPVSFVVKRRSA